MHILLIWLSRLLAPDAPEPPADPLDAMTPRERADLPPWHEPKAGHKDG